MTDTKTNGKVEAQREAALVDQLLEGCQKLENFADRRLRFEFRTDESPYFFSSSAFVCACNASNSGLSSRLVAVVIRSMNRMPLR